MNIERLDVPSGGSFHYTDDFDKINEIAAYKVKYEMHYKCDYLNMQNKQCGVVEKLFIMLNTKEEGWLIDQIGY